MTGVTQVQQLFLFHSQDNQIPHQFRPLENYGFASGFPPEQEGLTARYGARFLDRMHVKHCWHKHGVQKHNPGEETEMIEDPVHPDRRRLSLARREMASNTGWHYLGNESPGASVAPLFEDGEVRVVV